MIQIVIRGKSANEIIEIVHEMKSYGWHTGIHFDWEYYKASDYNQLHTRHAVFTFYKEEHSTYFVLRWVS